MNSPLLSGQGLGLTLGERSLFSALSFELNAGEVLALCGPSGRGKTSLLRGISGIGDLTTGQLLLRGRSREVVGPREWRKRVAWLPQEPPPLEGTMGEFAARVATLKARHGAEPPPVFLGRVGEQVERLGLSGQVTEQAFNTLSGGERARLYLALVLATEPEVLLLDEPTSALDGDTKLRVEEQLAGRTVILVTHDQEQIERLGARRWEPFR